MAGSAADGTDETDLLPLLASGGDLTRFLQGLVGLAVGQVPGAQACGLTLARSSRAVTVASTGPLAQQADEHQYAADDGPCLQSLRQDVVVLVEDMAEETRWGGYPRWAVDIGVRSSLSLPLVLDEVSRGALNLYSARPRAFAEEDRETAARWASHAADALAVALRIADSDDRAGNLADGLDTRTTIGQAIGLLMAQERCTTDQAFQLLKHASQRRNVKLREVAAGVVEAFERGLGDRPDRW
ncbi:GAF and ANTAR domain-containing protein [Geodermatophilus sp. SYSU D00758]